MKNKIRVLHIYKRMHRGGAETFVMNVLRNIDREKIQFDFLCTSKEPGAYDEEIKSLGGNIYYIKEPSKKHIIKNIKEIVSVLRENGPYDAIHIPIMFYSGIVCIAAKIAKVPKIIVHSHNSKDKIEKGLFRGLYAKSMRFLINIISTNKLACGIDASEFLFGNSKDVIIMNNGIDIGVFQNIKDNSKDKLKEDLGINSDELVIGNIARFVAEKNHKFFINLAKYIKEKNIKAKIVLVGEGELKQDVEDSINEENLNDFFVLTGLRKDIPELLGIMDVLVMPSIYEGFPVTIVESIASGVPCVLSNTIPAEVSLIDELVTFLDLNDSIDKWYEKINIMSKVSIDLEYIKQELNKKGFDIKETVKQLSNIYGVEK